MIDQGVGLEKGKSALHYYLSLFKCSYNFLGINSKVSMPRNHVPGQTCITLNINCQEMVYMFVCLFFVYTTLYGI